MNTIQPSATAYYYNPTLLGGPFDGATLEDYLLLPTEARKECSINLLRGAGLYSPKDSKWDVNILPTIVSEAELREYLDILRNRRGWSARFSKKM